MNFLILLALPFDTKCIEILANSKEDAFLKFKRTNIYYKYKNFIFNDNVYIIDKDEILHEKEIKENTG